MNKALEGNYKEVLITKLLNKKTTYWDVLPYDSKITYAIHVNSKKYGFVNQEKVQPKADIFFAKGTIEKADLEKRDYYLDEIDLVNFNLKPILNSGLSIKLSNSNYTITKISPNTFLKIFNSNMLGAGASIYSSKELEKNTSVIKGWSVEISDFKEYFSLKLGVSNIDLFDKDIMSLIKTFSNKELEKIIIQDKKISDLIFKGIGNFDEPFTATWLLENDVMKQNYYIPFSITTGSGRSKNIFTIVLKPK